MSLLWSLGSPLNSTILEIAPAQQNETLAGESFLACPECPGVIYVETCLGVVFLTSPGEEWHLSHNGKQRSQTRKMAGFCHELVDFLCR